MKEFIDFLGGQSPYDALAAEDLERLARAVEVEYFTAGSVIVPDGSPPLHCLYVVRTGAIEVLDRGRVIDLLGAGDTFGHVSVLSGLAPALEVRAAEDSLTYRLPDPRTILAHPEKLTFAHYGMLVSRERLTRATLLEAARRPVSRYLRPLVWGDHTTSVRDAARLVGEAGQSCLVVATPHGLGIVTDHDFRALIAGAAPDLAGEVSTIASAPALTVTEETSVTMAFLEMIEHGVHHLVVTGPDSVPVGIVRVVDLASADVRDPLLVRAAVEQAATVEELAHAVALLPATIVELADNGVPPTQVGALHSAVLDTVLGRLIAIDRADNPELAAAAGWMVLGSLARREALPGSDIDTALVWAETHAALDPAAMRAAAERVLTALETCGLSRCPDGANATNPLFSRSLHAWQRASNQWTRDPSGAGALLLASIVADSRPLTGVTLGRAVTDAMLAHTRSRAFFSALLRFTLQNKPPTGFVRDFVVDHSGQHRGQLDLKRGGLLPVASLGRWVALVTGDARGTTPDRLKRGAEAGLLTMGEAEALVGAFEEVYGLIFDREVDGIRSGVRNDTYVAPADLDSLTRRFLRETFREIAQIQARLQAEWAARLA